MTLFCLKLISIEKKYKKIRIIACNKCHISARTSAADINCTRFSKTGNKRFNRIRDECEQSNVPWGNEQEREEFFELKISWKTQSFRQALIRTFSMHRQWNRKGIFSNWVFGIGIRPRDACSVFSYTMDLVISNTEFINTLDMI